MIDKIVKTLKFLFLAIILAIFANFFNSSQAKAAIGYKIKASCEAEITGPNKPESNTISIPISYRMTGAGFGGIFGEDDDITGTLYCEASKKGNNTWVGEKAEIAKMEAFAGTGFHYYNGRASGAFYIDDKGRLIEKVHSAREDSKNLNRYAAATKNDEPEQEQNIWGNLYFVFDFGKLTFKYDSSGGGTPENAKIKGKIKWIPKNNTYYKQFIENNSSKNILENVVGIYLFQRASDTQDFHRVSKNFKLLKNELNLKTNEIEYSIDAELFSKNEYIIGAYFLIDKDGGSGKDYKGEKFPAVWSGGWWSGWNHLFGFSHDNYIGKSEEFDGQGESITKNFELKFVKRDTTGSSIQETLSEMAQAVNEALEKIIRYIIGELDHLLIIDNLQNNPTVTDVWNDIRTISNLLLIIGILLIALFNAIRFQIEYYTAKALIPRLIAAAIFINFSLLLTQIILDLGNVLTDFLLAETQISGIFPTSITGDITSLAATIGGVIALVLFHGILLLSVLIAVVMILVVLVLRVAVIWVLAILSPLIFLFSILPFTRGLASTWWNYLVKYVFMGTVIAIFLRIAGGVSLGTKISAEATINDFLHTVVLIVLLIAAAVSPFVLGDRLAGAVTGKIGDWTKGMKRNAKARALGTKMLEGRQSRKERRQEAALAGMGTGVRGRLKGALGRGVLGKEQQLAMTQKAVGTGAILPRPSLIYKLGGGIGKQAEYRRVFNKMAQSGVNIKKLAAETWKDKNAFAALNDGEVHTLATEGDKQSIENVDNVLEKNPRLLINRSPGLGKFMLQSMVNLKPNQLSNLIGKAENDKKIKGKLKDYFEQINAKFDSSDYGAFDPGMFGGNKANDYITINMTKAQAGNITNPKSLIGAGRHDKLDAVLRGPWKWNKGAKRYNRNPGHFNNGSDIKDTIKQELDRLKTWEGGKGDREIPEFPPPPPKK